MKSRQLIAGLIAISVMALGTVAFAAAQIEYYPDLNYSAKGVIWWFKTEDYSGSFNGNDIIRSSIVVQYWDASGNVFTLKPMLTLITKNFVMLVFCPHNVPTDGAGASVSGTLKNGDTFIASGPGFGWGRH